MHAELRCNVYLIAVRTYQSLLYCLRHCVTIVYHRMLQDLHPHIHTHSTMQLHLPSLTDLDEHISWSSCVIHKHAHTHPVPTQTAHHLCAHIATNTHLHPSHYRQPQPHTLAPFTLQTSTNTHLHPFTQTSTNTHLHPSHTNKHLHPSHNQAQTCNWTYTCKGELLGEMNRVIN